MNTDQKQAFFAVPSNNVLQGPLTIVPYWLDHMHAAGPGFICFQTARASGTPGKKSLWIHELEYKKHPEHYGNAAVVTDRDEFGNNPLQYLVWETENKVPKTRQIVTALVKHPQSMIRYEETGRWGICNPLRKCIPKDLLERVDEFSLAADHISLNGDDVVITKIAELLMEVIDKWRGEYDDQKPYIVRIG